MTRQEEVRIPPKRLHLLGIFLGCILALPITFGMLRAVLAAAEQQQSFIPTAVAVVLVICAIVTVPYLVLFAIWAFVRLVFNLPALILTREGIVNHSCVYHVVIPWREIDQFVRDLTIAPASSSSRWMRGQGKLVDTTILVLGHDQRRLYEQQQPLTRALLWLFNVLRPININTDVIAWSQDELWAQLERYVRETLGNTSIKFVTLRPKSSGKL